MTQISEKRITKKMKELLKQRFGGFWFKVHGGPFQAAGIPDLIGCAEGCFIAIEVKRPERMDQVSTLQAVTLDQISRSGGLAFVACDPEEAVKRVAEYLSTS